MTTRTISCLLPGLFLAASSAYALDVPFDQGRDISGPFNDVRSVSPADIDKDGRNDVVGASFGGNEIAWWRNADGSATNWTRTVIAPSYTGATCVLEPSGIVMACVPAGEFLMGSAGSNADAVAGE